MPGMNDGVSNLWVVRCERGLDIDGFKDEFEAIDRLIRRVLVKDGDAAKARIRAVVEDALRHMDEDDATEIDSDG